MPIIMHTTHFIVAIVMVVSFVASSATSADEPALDSIKYYPDDPGVALPPKDEPKGLPEAPPNCEWIVIEGEMVVAVYLECHLPPECVRLTIGEEGGPQFVFIECDIPPNCQLNSGTTEGGVTYWYITCLEVSNESACEQIREQMDSGALPAAHVWAWYIENCVEPEFDTIVHSPAPAGARGFGFIPVEPPTFDDSQVVPVEPPTFDDSQVIPVEPPSRDFRVAPKVQYNCDELEYAISNGLLVSEDAWNWYHRNCVDDTREPDGQDNPPGGKPSSPGRPADKPQPPVDPQPEDPAPGKPAPEREPEREEPRDDELEAGRDERKPDLEIEEREVPQRESEDREPMELGR